MPRYDAAYRLLRDDPSSFGDLCNATIQTQETLNAIRDIVDAATNRSWWFSETRQENDHAFLSLGRYITQHCRFRVRRQHFVPLEEEFLVGANGLVTISGTTGTCAHDVVHRLAARLSHIILTAYSQEDKDWLPSFSNTDIQRPRPQFSQADLSPAMFTKVGMLAAAKRSRGDDDGTTWWVIGPYIQIFEMDLLVAPQLLSEYEEILETWCVDSGLFEPGEGWRLLDYADRHTRRLAIADHDRRRIESDLETLDERLQEHEAQDRAWLTASAKLIRTWIQDYFPFNGNDHATLEAGVFREFVIARNARQASPERIKAVRPPAEIVGLNIDEPLPENSDDRDKWIYESAVRGVPWQMLQVRLEGLCEENGWKPIITPRGVRLAAFNYADRNRLPSPPVGEGGFVDPTPKPPEDDGSF